MRLLNEPLHRMCRCTSETCKRWQSVEQRDNTLSATLFVALSCCSFCGGELELVDMHAHVAALPAGKESADGGTLVEEKRK